MTNAKYIISSFYFDFENDQIQTLIDPIKQLKTDQEKAIAAYLKVRDGWRYSADKISFNKEAYRASEIAKKQEAHCIDKSIILIALLRGLGIPARLHLAKIKNHIAVERIIEKIGSDELTHLMGW